MLELFGMFVLALAPIIWLVIALCGLHMEAYLASLGALVVAAACAALGWGMTPANMATAALEGFAMALWPIVIVIIAAVFTYNLTVHTGAMETIKRMLCSVSADRRVLTWAGQPIPHLYAVGEIASALKFVYQGGGNLTECLVFGQVCGKIVAKLPNRA